MNKSKFLPITTLSFLLLVSITLNIVLGVWLSNEVDYDVDVNIVERVNDCSFSVRYINAAPYPNSLDYLSLL